MLVELHGCPPSILDDPARIEAVMVAAAEAGKATIVQRVFHQFAPQGVSGVVVVSESHLSVHTWPEHGYAAVDFFTCGEGDPDAAVPVLREGLEAARVESRIVQRGDGPLRFADRG